MEEIILTRPEFLVLLDAVGASAVIGIDAQALVPESIEEYRQLVEEGQRLLAERGLLVVTQDGVRALDQRLALIAQTVLRPEIAIVSLRELPNAGQQLFLHYQREDAVIEQTFPAPGQHRLAILPNVNALFERLLVIFPVQTTPDGTNSAQLAQELFETARTLAAGGDRIQAQAVLEQSGVTHDLVVDLVGSLAEPTFSGTIALLRCVGEEVVDARNPLIIQGPATAWSIVQSSPGQSVLHVQPVHANQFQNQIQELLDELRHE